MKRADYVGHLREMRSWKGISLEPAMISRLENHLPEHFWMIEASAQELFTASRRKFGELLLSCTTSLPRPLNLSLLLAARLPGLVLVSHPEGLATASSQLQGHTPIFSTLPPA